MAFHGIRLSPEMRAALDTERAEISRMWSLPDRFLAEDLLRKIRWCRERYPSLFDRKDGYYGDSTTSFAWDIVPEIAFRLGAGSFAPLERSRADVRSADGERLRHWLGHALNGMGFIDDAWDDGGAKPNPWLMLTRDCQNGNPVVFALDRVAPPTNESSDLPARLLREVSWHRGFEPVSSWSPALQDYGRRLNCLDEDEGRDEEVDESGAVPTF